MTFDKFDICVVQLRCRTIRYAWHKICPVGEILICKARKFERQEEEEESACAGEEVLCCLLLKVFCCFELNWGDRELQQEMIFVQTSLDVRKGCIKQTLNANACIYTHFGSYWLGLIYI